MKKPREKTYWIPAFLGSPCLERSEIMKCSCRAAAAYNYRRRLGVERRLSHVKAPVTRRAVAGNRTSSATAETTSLPLSWSQASGTPEGADGHYLRPQNGHGLGRSSPRFGAGMRSHLS